MSTRIGMADGRCITEFTSNRLLQDAIYLKNNISVFDNYKFRQMAQEKGPDGMSLPMSNQACGNPSTVYTLVSSESPPPGNC